MISLVRVCYFIWPMVSLKAPMVKCSLIKHSLAKFSQNKRLYLHHQNIPLLTKNPELIDRLNVFDNVSLPLRIRGISQDEINHGKRDALKELDIKHLEFASPRKFIDWCAAKNLYCSFYSP